MSLSLYNFKKITNLSNMKKYYDEVEKNGSKNLLSNGAVA